MILKKNQFWAGLGLRATVTESADFGFIPDNSITLTSPESPGVSREAKLFTEFEFGSLVR